MKTKLFFYLILTLELISFKLYSSDEPKKNLRAPAYPLITIDPYMSLWSMNDTLYNDVMRHWTEIRQSLIGAIRVDGKVYRFLGKEELPLKVIVPMADKEKWNCKYSFEEPKENWFADNFNDAKWQNGFAAFGTKDEPSAKTLWETQHIFVRREFKLDKYTTDETLYLVYTHDDDLDLYLNGTKIVSTGNKCSKDALLKLDEKLLNKTGTNIIAAHCYNRVGAAILDFGILQERKTYQQFKNTAVQNSVELSATQTTYNFTCGTIDLKLKFTSPLLPNNLDILSRPINYISYEIISNDGNKHDVQIYFEATPENAVDVVSQKISATKNKFGKINYLKTGTTEQNILGKKGDNRRIDWGYFYLGGIENENFDYAIGEYQKTKKEFIESGKITQIKSIEIISNMDELMPVLAISHSHKQVGDQSVGNFIMLGYDDIKSIQYFGENLNAWWRKSENENFENLLEKSYSDYNEIMKSCSEFDAQLKNDAIISGGEEYADLCILAFRQSIAAHKLVKDSNGEILFFSKENFSNGSIGTVDVTYPSAPLFLYYNPDLLKGMLNPIFYYAESGKWQKQFAPHDVGTYPIANGQTYGGDMPVEESGNMLILTAAIAHIEGNANYAQKHWETLKIWADYLLANGLDPENQLCTDDFAGHFAHNTNLSVKAILGIASFGKIAKMLGEKELGEKYLSNAKEMAIKWEQMAFDKDHYKLTFDQPGTWSQKYNLVWDQQLGFNLFNKNIIDTEIKYYLTKQNEFGLPLDNRRTYTKSDWIIWTASLTNDVETFKKFIIPIYKFVNETPDRVPMTDWYETINAKQVGFQARSVVGGYFIKMLKDKIESKK
ncbi:MAG: DUF4965 domain-containing protein [Ignavibacteriae bacterium]|nr:DUF4965 domain-containing protein [Ignavibacteriota bacterium]